MSEWLVAVDFGTTATAAAVRSGDGPARALVFGDGGSTVPSSVYAEGPGQLLVGTEADNEAEFRLDAYEPTPKRRVGEQTVRLGNWDFRPAELIGAVIASVLAEAMRQHQNTVPSQVVLTHPAAWRASRRAVLTDALTVAASRLAVALPAPKFIAEPVAAAQWYAHSRGHTDGAVFAVYDLGGGTFDTTILRAGRDGFDVMASGGIDPLGGFDFDTALFSHLGQTYIAAADPTLWTAMSSTERADPDIARQRRRLQQRVTLLKIGLSTSTDKRIQLPGLEGPAVVTRGEYEALIAGHLEATITELQDTIADAGMTSEQLAAIYRIGGASRTPLVGAELERLRVPVEVLDQPKLVVAQGAAMNSRPTAAASTATEKVAVPASETTGGEPDEPSTAHEGTVDPAAESQPQLVDEDLDSAPGNDVLESGPVPPLISLWKLALRAFALGPLSIVLVYATGFSWPLTMLFGHAGSAS